MIKNKVVLVIMDGFGIGEETPYNAVLNAKTPNLDRLIREYPNVQLKSDGMAVGLPDGQFGTSEVNHQVIGAGRVILQDLPRINEAIRTGAFFKNPALIEACSHAVKNKSKLHLIGIISDGGVHSMISHFEAMINLATQQKVQKLFIHAFTDGRDVPPKSAQSYFEQLSDYLKGTPYKIATIQGRFYLDRDRDWEKTQKAIDLITKGKGMKVNDYQSALNFSYNQNITDEFFGQFLIDLEGLVSENDSVITMHYRSDRIFQLQQSLLNEKIKNLKITGFISASNEFDIAEAFPREEINNTLSETLAKYEKKQLHITETEKFSHLTYFFNGGREKEFSNETWKLIQSNRFVKPFYNFEPSMRVTEITSEVINAIEQDKYDFLVVNYPNCDMVGHTGNYNAAVIATESVDYAIGKIYESIKNKLGDYSLIVTADHGNAEEMWDYENNQPHTQHTTNKVPFILVSEKFKSHRLKVRETLEDIAPTVLDLMGLPKPKEMTGESLI
ncbi:MAG: 2,3-bisphosphoglycerate-independent phosphoglycerate mutase [Candidatus Dojkabacteria bacterium]|nr:MAG: 2,3-bisphosphoglycerate-independent phosphoglycerate mutase [Candidatus Dojkabacteria bacterium]